MTIRVTQNSIVDLESIKIDQFPAPQMHEYLSLKVDGLEKRLQVVVFDDECTLIFNELAKIADHISKYTIGLLRNSHFEQNLSTLTKLSNLNYRVIKLIDRAWRFSSILAKLHRTYIHNYLKTAKDYDPEILKMFEILKSSKAGSEFLYRALNVHLSKSDEPLQVQFVDPEKVPFGALNDNINTIQITKEASFPEKFFYFLFELTNVINFSLYQQINQNLSQFKDAEEFAKAHEKIEYEGVKMQSELIKKCVAEDNWDPSLDRFGRSIEENWQTFEKYWQTQLATGHVAFYCDWFKSLVC